MKLSKDQKNVLLFPTAIESGTGGQTGPIFEDDTFVYIPVPRVTKQYRGCTINLPTYREMAVSPFTSNRNLTETVLADFLKEHVWTVKDRNMSDKLPNYVVHHDPEFQTFTYGQGSCNKRSSLANLRKGDLLVFYVRLTPYKKSSPAWKFLIGYFIIEQVYDFRDLGPLNEAQTKIPADIQNNAHIKEYQAQIKEDLQPVIVTGNRAESRFLEKAIPFTNKKYEVFPEIIQEVTPWPYETNRVPRGTRVFRGDHYFESWLRILQYKGPSQLYKYNIFNEE